MTRCPKKHEVLFYHAKESKLFFIHKQNSLHNFQDNHLSSTFEDNLVNCRRAKPAKGHPTRLSSRISELQLRSHCPRSVMQPVHMFDSQGQISLDLPSSSRRP